LAAPELRIQVLPHHSGLPLPEYQTAGAAGMDLVAALESAVVLRSLERFAVPTGLCVAIPDGYEGQVRARSGMALRMGLGMANAPGTIDSDYRGELKALVINLSDRPITIERGMRVAQLVIAPVVRVDIAVVDTLDETDRGAGGFGSTGAR
jgi:dUTP pyrophosphatase